MKMRAVLINGLCFHFLFAPFVFVRDTLLEACGMADPALEHTAESIGQIHLHSGIDVW